MASIRTNRRFASAPDMELSKFAGKIVAGLTGNASLPTPPVMPVDLAAQKKAFDDAIIAAENGGSLATARKNAVRMELVVALNKDASYVDINCGEELATLLSSGYEAVSTNRAQRVLNPPQVLAVENAQKGELRARVKADPNSKSFVGRIKEANGTEYGPTISFKNSRSILFKGLTAGMTYVFELMAIGGSTGQSDWSDPNTGMSQ